MATGGFFNVNQYRDYPFVPRVSPLDVEGMSESSQQMLEELPQACIVDFGAIIRPAATFSVSFDSVYLRSIERRGAVLIFAFAVSSMPFAYTIEFDVDTEDTEEFTTQWGHSAPIAYSDAGVYACDDAPVWSAYLVTGDLTALMQLIPDNETLFFVEELWRIMPGRIQSLVRTQVQSIAIANVQRTVVTPPPDCEGGSLAMTNPPTAHIAARCIVGDVTFHEGYNCSIRHDLRENAIVIGAGVGAGAGQVCEEVPAYDGEPKPDGSPFYSGGPDCASVVKYINGINNSDFKIIAGPGFTVAADPDLPNTLVIERSLNASILCTPITPELPGSSASLSEQLENYDYAAFLATWPGGTPAVGHKRTPNR